MTRFMFLLGVLVLAALSAQPAQAQERERLRDKFDSDKDGKISATERQAARESLQAEVERRRAERLEKHPEVDGDAKGKARRAAGPERGKRPMLRRFIIGRRLMAGPPDSESRRSAARSGKSDRDRARSDDRGRGKARFEGLRRHFQMRLENRRGAERIQRQPERRTERPRHPAPPQRKRDV